MVYFIYIIILVHLTGNLNIGKMFIKIWIGMWLYLRRNPIVSKGINTFEEL